MKATIYPTGKCFDNAMDFLNDEFKKDKVTAFLCNYHLVHGICTLNNEVPFAHAWVESGNAVIDSGLYQKKIVYYKSEKEEYYKVMGVQKCTRYTIEQMLELNYKYETFGPWTLEYIKLCKNYNPAIHDRMFAHV